MAFLEELKYELWEFGWDGLQKCLKLLIPFLIACFGWKYWKNSYARRRNEYGLRLEQPVQGYVQSVEPNIFIWQGWQGAKVITLGYYVTYTYDYYGQIYEGKDYLPRNNEWAINQMIKQLKDSTYHHHILIRVRQNNPEESQIVIQPLVYY